MRPVGLKGDRRVVIQPGRAPLEERSDHQHVLLARHGAQPLRARPRNRLGQIEQSDVFALAEILRAEELRQANDLRSGARGFAHAVGSLLQIRVRIGRAGHLHQANAVFQSSRHVVSVSSHS